MRVYVCVCVSKLSCSVAVQYVMAVYGGVHCKFTDFDLLSVLKLAVDLRVQIPL